jgi:hypothetical protein
MESETVQASILRAIDQFIELRQSEWGNIHNQTGEFNPHVTRYDMLQKFRKAVERGDLETYDFPEGVTLEAQIFQMWKQLAVQSVGEENFWGHPIGLAAIYGHLPWRTWEVFLQELTVLQDPAMELVPSRSKNWLVNDRSVGAVTFHQV